MRPILLPMTLLGLLLTAGCDRPQETDGGAAKKKGDEAHLVEIEEVRRAPISSTHQFTGSLLARRVVNIHSQEEGQVEGLSWFEGDRVRAGEPLVLLADDLLAAELDKARAVVRQARKDLDRNRDLVAKRAASEDALTQAATALEIAEAEQRLLQTRLSHTRILAPFDGVVSARLVEPGDVVAKHAPLLTLFAPESLVAEIRVSELILPRIRVGDPVEVRIDALGDQVFAGKVARIHPSLDPLTRQGVVEIALQPIPEAARAGQFLRATLQTAQVERITLPFTAIRHDSSGEFVFRVDEEGSARRTAVRSGMRIADRIEIMEGVEEGWQIVRRGFLGLTEGKRVLPVE